jgi:hypothetical protein
VLSHTDDISDDKLATAVALVRAKNLTASLVTAPWDTLSGQAILSGKDAQSFQGTASNAVPFLFVTC